jgi:hypothetical protein
MNIILKHKEKDVDKKGAKDDIDLLKKPGKSGFESTTSPLEKLEDKTLKKKSRISRFFSKISAGASYLKNTKIGKILLSSALSYTVSIVFISLAFAAVFSPLSPLAIAIGVIGLAGIGSSLIYETYKIHSLRKLQKERNLLVQNRNAKSVQDYILDLNPNLKTILRNEINTIPTGKHNAAKPKYKIKSKKLETVTQTIANNIGGVGYFAGYIASGVLTNNVIAILKATTYGVMATRSLITSGLSAAKRNDLDTIFKATINAENKNADTPYYKNLKELEDATKEQLIQTIALKELITYPSDKNSSDKSYWHMSDDEKREKFAEIKSNITAEVAKKNGLKAVLEKNNYLLDTGKANPLKAFKNALNPFYKEPTIPSSPPATPINPQKTKNIDHTITQVYSPLAKAMHSAQTKKENAQRGK